MTKLKQLKMKYRAALGLLVVAVLVGTGMMAHAYSNSSSQAPKVVNEKGGIVNFNESPVVMSSDGEQTLGALSSPVIPYNYLQVGGIDWQYSAPGAMQTATTTLCSIPNPFSTTSTIEAFDYQITTGTSTASTIVGSISTSAYVTSTATNFLAAQTVGSGAQDSLSITPTVDAGIVGPNQYVLLKTEGAGLGGYTYTGKCQAVFRKMPN